MITNSENMENITSILNVLYIAALQANTEVPDGVLDVDTKSVEIAFVVLSKYLTKEETNSLRASIFFNNSHKVMILNKSSLGKLLYKGAKTVYELTHNTEEK